MPGINVTDDSYANFSPSQITDFMTVPQNLCICCLTWLLLWKRKLWNIGIKFHSNNPQSRKQKQPPRKLKRKRNTTSLEEYLAGARLPSPWQYLGIQEGPEASLPSLIKASKRWKNERPTMVTAHISLYYKKQSTRHVLRETFPVFKSKFTVIGAMFQSYIDY